MYKEVVVSLLFRNEFLETQNDLLHKCYSEQLEIKEKLNKILDNKNKEEKWK